MQIIMVGVPQKYQLLSNYSEFSCHGYCVIHGTNYMVYVTNTQYCGLIGSTTIVVITQVPYTLVTRSFLYNAKEQALPDYACIQYFGVYSFIITLVTLQPAAICTTPALKMCNLYPVHCIVCIPLKQTPI